MEPVRHGAPVIRGTRRDLLRSSVFAAVTTSLAACAPATPQPAPAAPEAKSPDAGAAWQDEWNRLVAAAKGEGKLTVHFTGVGTGYAKLADAFRDAFPGIEAEFGTLGTASLFLPKFWREREAGVYSYDVVTVQAAYGIPELRDKKALVPIRPQITHPDVLDTAKWVKGFEAGFVDAEKRWGYSGGWGERILLYRNTDLVKDGEVTTAKDLLNPKWKGKIAWLDPAHGGTFWQVSILRLTQGEEFVTALFTEQQPQWVGRDDRVLTEAILRGRYAIGYSREAILADFRANGLGNNVQPLRLSDARLAALDAPLWMPEKPPHPNAAKLFVNWLLSQQGNSAYSRLNFVNSRRTDVPPVDENAYVSPEKAGDFKYVFGDESEIVDSNKALALLQKLKQ